LVFRAGVGGEHLHDYTHADNVAKDEKKISEGGSLGRGKELEMKELFGV
jgi:hypothetical protein